MMEFAFLVEEDQAASFVQLLSLAGLVQEEPLLAVPYAGLDLVVPLSSESLFEEILVILSAVVFPAE
jgi:hypothetical protein